jgi:hypothetical protein
MSATAPETPARVRSSYPTASEWFENTNKWVVLRHEWNEQEDGARLFTLTEIVFASDKLAEAQAYLACRTDDFGGRYDLMFLEDDYVLVAEDSK